ncbi:MAG: hypothetical protein V4467_05155 [Patescibacteria group bacterium]
MEEPTQNTPGTESKVLVKNWMDDSAMPEATKKLLKRMSRFKGPKGERPKPDRAVEGFTPRYGSRSRRPSKR